MIYWSHCILNSVHFLGLLELKNLDLSANAIGSLTTPTFTFMPNLRSLDLRENRIAFISLDAFEGLGNLEKLDLSFWVQNLPINSIIWKKEKNFELLNNWKRCKSIELLDNLKLKCSIKSIIWTGKILDLQYNFERKNFFGLVNYLKWWKNFD